MALWEMAQSNSWIFPLKTVDLSTANCESFAEGKYHEIPWKTTTKSLCSYVFSIVMLNFQRVNLHFPMVFPWCSHFPMFFDITRGYQRTHQGPVEQVHRASLAPRTRMATMPRRMAMDPSIHFPAIQMVTKGCWVFNHSSYSFIYIYIYR